MKNNILPVGSNIQVTSNSHFRGLIGTILMVDNIAADLEEPVCFYLISLEGANIKEPIWFDYDEVDFIAEMLHMHPPANARHCEIIHQR